MNFFQKMASAKQTEITELKASQINFSRLEKNKNSFATALSPPGLGLIAEIKRSNPITGVVQKNIDLRKIIESYNQCAAAISVVVEKLFFNGNISDLDYVSQNSTKPILVKDVILEEIQIDFYRLHGANAILLNANLLSKTRLEKLSKHVLSYDMDPFVEIHNMHEFQTALEIDTKIIAIHNINPETWKTDNTVTEKILSQTDKNAIKDKIIVHASGIKTLEYFKKIKMMEVVKAVLVGTAFVEDPKLIYNFKQELK